MERKLPPQLHPQQIITVRKIHGNVAGATIGSSNADGGFSIPFATPQTSDYAYNGGGGIGGFSISPADPVVQDLHMIATGLDVIAWGIDLYNAGVVVAGGIIGAGVGLPFAEGGPEVPPVTGLAGMGIAELYVQPTMIYANVLSGASTALTAVADIRAGNTNLQQGVFGTQTLNGVTTTAWGVADREAITNLVIQSVAVSNDLGWTSFPFP